MYRYIYIYMYIYIYIYIYIYLLKNERASALPVIINPPMLSC